MTKEQQKQALKAWFKEVSDEIQTVSFEFTGSVIPFGAGLALGVISKHFKELEEIIDDNQMEIEKIAEEICNNYCKYPMQAPPEGKNENWLSEDDASPCLKCPLNRL